MKQIVANLQFLVPDCITDANIDSYFDEIELRINDYLEEEFEEDSESVKLEFKNIYERSTL